MITLINQRIICFDELVKDIYYVNKINSIFYRRNKKKLTK